eukprot:c19656_g1_i1 orf=820-2871(-)
MGRARAVSQSKPTSVWGIARGYFDSAVVYRKEAVLSRNQSEDAVVDGVEGQFVAGETEIGEEEEGGSADGRPSMRRWACSICGFNFDSLEGQRLHFKSDFHRANIKRSLVGKNPLNEEEFEVLVNRDGDDDISSISGSDEEASDSPDDVVTSQRTSSVGHHITFLLQDSGEIISISKSVLLGYKEEFEETGSSNPKSGEPFLLLTEEDLLKRLKSLASDITEQKKIWVLLLAKGGHFAGCVYDLRGGSLLAHKTYHRYVVRGKAGGKQSTKDATGRAPKSAGASLRRYNEMALQKEIREVLGIWKGYLESASCIFVHAPSSNSQAFFGGEDRPLDRHDARIRHIPFTTRRPTLKEVNRVFHLLAAINYMEEDDAEDSCREEENSEVTPVIITEGKHSTEVSQNSVSGLDRANNDSTDTTSRLESGPFGEVSLTSEVLCPGVLPQDKSTPLHDAASSGNANLVLELLENGANPSARDERGRVPYTVAADKETRDAFRKFMAGHLEMWDWHAANVPSPLTDEMEAAKIAKQAEKDAKRKAKAKEQKKLRKAKEKAQAHANTEKLVEAASLVVCHGKAALSHNQLKEMPVDTDSAAFKEALKKAQELERKKRAIAAEKRMSAVPNSVAGNAAAHGIGPQVNSSNTCDSCCSSCGVSLSGKIPFYRFSYKYCSTACVNIHRKILEGG